MYEMFWLSIHGPFFENFIVYSEKKNLLLGLKFFYILAHPLSLYLLQMWTNTLSTIYAIYKHCALKTSTLY